MFRRLIPRSVLVLLGSGVFVILGPAGVASAHSLSPSGSSNYLSMLRTVTPAVAGVSMRVVDDGMHVELTNTTATPLVLLGYSGEPYLRVDRSGVWENERSPSLYLNATSQPGLVYVPPDATATAAPLWRQVCRCDTARWHDHRVHWGQSSPPAAAQAAPNRYHLIDPWKLTATYGSEAVDFDGTLAWVQGPSPTPWLGLAVAAAVLVGLAGLLSRWRLVMATALLAVVAIDVGRALGAVFGRSGPLHIQLQAIPDDGVFTAVLWLSALVLAGWILRGSVDAVLGGAICGLILALISGAATMPALWHSQVVTAFPMDVQRILVALTLGFGVGVFAAGLLIFRRVEPSTRSRSSGSGDQGRVGDEGWEPEEALGLVERHHVT